MPWNNLPPQTSGFVDMERETRRLLATICLGLCVWCQKVVSAQKSTETAEAQEYCEWETFNATCGPGEVIMIQGARYGRMNLGRCITKDYGNIGCGTDVTSDFDRKCSGKSTCTISVISLHTKRDCPKDFKSYLEAGYKCVKVHHPETTACPESGHLTLAGPSGYIASSVALETGLGNGSCPFIIEVEPYQRINFTLVDLNMAVGSNHWFYGGQESHLDNCEVLATIQEPGWSEVRTVCGGRARESIVYTTKGDRLEVRMSLLAAKSNRFLLRYEAFGCPPLAGSENAWSESYGDHMVVRCNHTDAAWYLTCQGSHWVGDVGNCSAAVIDSGKKWGLSALAGVSDFPLGILIVVTLGVAIGVAVGVMMLVAVLAYMKRRRRRKVRSRSNYALKQVPHSQPQTPKPGVGDTGTWHSDIRTPMLYNKPLDTDASSPGKQSRSYLDTWQRSRPLPVPRPPTSDSGIEQETDGLTMTPESPSSSIFTTFRPDFERTMILNGHAHAHAHRPTDFGGEHVAPYYFKVDTKSWPASPPGGDYGTGKKPDVLSTTCNLCKNTGPKPHMTNV